MAHKQARSMTALLNSIPPVDLVIAGDGYTTTYEQMNIENTLVSFAGNRGRKLIMVKGFDLDRKSKRFEQKIVPITTAIEEDQGIHKLVEAAEEAAAKARSSRNFREEALRDYGGQNRP
jgi:hypothetical protein